jgi:hypothetical protein
MEAIGRRAVPAWFWAVAVAALLWEGMGCVQYMKQSPQAAALPAWVWSAFAVAVWVGLLGTILLLLRLRWARLAFALSLLGALVQFGWAFAKTGVTPLGIVVLVVAAALLWFADFAAKRGWLH